MSGSCLLSAQKFPGRGNTSNLTANSHILALLTRTCTTYTGSRILSFSLSGYPRNTQYNVLSQGNLSSTSRRKPAHLKTPTANPPEHHIPAFPNRTLSAHPLKGPKRRITKVYDNGNLCRPKATFLRIQAPLHKSTRRHNRRSRQRR